MASETTADICAEMRTEAARADMEQGYSIDDAAEAMREFAWRIEAAHKREVGVSKTETTTKENLVVGNNAKCREALDIISRTELPPNSHTTEAGEVITFADGNRWLGMMRTVVALAKYALAAPPRNCDRFPTVTEASNAFICELCEHPCGNCTVSDEYHNPLIHECGIKWLFAEAKGLNNDK